MKPLWTGRLIGKMHNDDVTLDDLAGSLGVTKSYVSMILNGARFPQGAQKRLESAYKDVLDRRKEVQNG